VNWRFWRKEKPEETPDHQHVYLAKLARIVTEGNGDVVTVLVRNCDCGDMEYFRIPGVWTMEELTGRPPVFNDDKFLRDCGIKA
jgi:hypothetical protein